MIGTVCRDIRDIESDHNKHRGGKARRNENGWPEVETALDVAATSVDHHDLLSNIGTNVSEQHAKSLRPIDWPSAFGYFAFLFRCCQCARTP